MTLKGADYVAVNRITTKAEEVLAMPGETCDDVPAGALEWLLAAGDIAKADPAEKKRATKARTKGKG